jgi:hypothetical protein
MMFYAGYMGWSIYGALAVFNTMYYFDIYKRHFMDNYMRNNKGDMAFWSSFTGANFIRLHISMVVWAVMLLGWAITTLGWTFPVLHVLFYGMT